MAYDLVIDKWDEYAIRRLNQEFGMLSILNYDGSFGDFSCLSPYAGKIEKLKISMPVPAGHKLHLLTRLKYLSVTEEFPALNFSVFNCLEGLDFEWSKK